MVAAIVKAPKGLLLSALTMTSASQQDHHHRITMIRNTVINAANPPGLPDFFASHLAQ